ncbi:hypothetical protein LH67_07205 [Xenorhabdus nematophila]|nr:hypothetical protein LH67_07205 [Xenorhabdus nematophila]
MISSLIRSIIDHTLISAPYLYNQQDKVTSCNALSADFRLSESIAQIEPSLYRSSEYSRRAFCSQCGSSLGAIDDGPTVGLILGNVDN